MGKNKKKKSASNDFIAFDFDIGSPTPPSPAIYKNQPKKTFTPSVDFPPIFKSLGHFIAIATASIAKEDGFALAKLLQIHVNVGRRSSLFSIEVYAQLQICDRARTKTIQSL
jgi:hypothetical protein